MKKQITPSFFYIIAHLLLKGNIALEKSKRKKPFTWLPDQTWEDCVRLANDFNTPFGSLLEEIERHEKTWKAVCKPLRQKQ